MIAAQTRSLAETFQPEGQLAKAVWFVSLALIGTALMTLAAKTKIDMVFVNVTMQTFAVFAIAAAYGSRLAVATMALYLLEGALGMPVFTGTPEKGIGLAYMVSSTGGYLIAYLAAAWVVGLAADKGFARNPVVMGVAMLAGEAIILSLGFLWMAYLFGFEKAFAFGVGPFIIADILKLALAAAIVPAVGSLLKRR
ncbi:biotin transporter BioY [Phyllobacterium myrsinacearum]|uniref:Biotin transporter n=1 Tax=Phyllobacterium myrsinacearum TaxID=28101 RepID=A0A2S9JBF6_9HYPH|nr:biotin transporter BioY [Phyllobacterium myrsinacearum]PWV90785.1 biotin transport system substrate-specific component [Phyllobacterium myrsinacearum]RZU97187.1 biotin transport system substrate-specific component [Phyllobacterium myrsinacearum]